LYIDTLLRVILNFYFKINQMRDFKQLILITSLSLLIVACAKNTAEEEIQELKAEIARLQSNTSIDNEAPTDIRDEIIERYPMGEKKLVVTYGGKGNREFVLRKRSYYQNGQIKEEENYKNSELDGDYREYYKNGQISVKCSYNEGKRDGEFFEFYHDGVVWEHGYFTHGEYDGEYSTYFVDGKRKSYELYKEGDRLEAVWYDNQGNIEYKN
jgi:antitoxin component YwqK of YwqJK toxin-antitoxin module